MLNGLSLFTGIGGIDLALSEWVRPVAYCEIDRYAAAVLFSRMLDGALPEAPVFPDVRQLSADILPSIDIIYGGFPCQDVSLAGARKGLEGERSGLFFQIVRLTAQCRPAFVFLENVPGIKPYRKAIFTAFEDLGYECRDGTLAAGHLGACHIRNRWWFIAHASENGRRELHRSEQECWGGARIRPILATLANRYPERLQRTRAARQGRARLENNITFSDDSGERRGSRRAEPAREERRSGINFGSRWPTKPGVCGRDDVIPRRVDRIKCLGNAVHVPTAKEAFKRLMGLLHEKEYSGSIRGHNIDETK